MFTIGLTGGIGSGKSTVAKWFKKQGVPVLDADKTVHRLFEADSSILSTLIHEFGSEIVGENGEINRSKLGLRIFRDQDARKLLERIVHPRVVECMKAEQATLRDSGTKFCVWDVPLLLETGFERFVDQVWVVWVPRHLQISRVLARDKLNLAEVEARIAAQGSLDEKCEKADVVIDNSGCELDTEHQLQINWKKIMYNHH
ncbi:MAG TPA: dephospho-CoA kinase [Desulfosporosinus sp.]|nr:dephospho-CoA kinase [Desulfosporosinus sp.]